MTTNINEFRIKHLPFFLLACIAYNIFVLHFTPATGAIALLTAIFLSIEPESESRQKYVGLISALAAGTGVRLLALFGLIGLNSWLPEIIVSIAALIFIIWYSKRPASSTPLTFFLIPFSFIVAGADVARYPSLIFFPLAGALVTSVIFIRLNEKSRIHKRAKLRKERSAK